MTDQSSPMSTAERSRLYRERKRSNVHLITIEVDEALLNGLVSYGFVRETDSEDRDEIEDGLAILMYAVAEGAIDFSAEWLSQFE